MKLTAENTSTLVIDLQGKIVAAMTDADQLVERSKYLVQGLKIYSVPIVSTRQYPKGLGDTLPEISELLGDAPVFDKTSFSCLAEPEIRNWFIKDSRPNVILAGIETHICVQQTALDLLEAGKRVYLIADCCSTRFPFDGAIALQRLQNAGVVVTTAESALYEIAGRAGSPEFKDLGKLSKAR